MDEQIIEQGYIKRIDGDIVEISIARGDQCSSCDNLFCKPHKEGDDNENTLFAVDEMGAEIGDLVKVSIAGSTVFKATFYVWVMPLIMLIGGIYLGTVLFGEIKLYEVYSFGLGIAMILLYFGVISKVKPSSSKKSMPKIISVTKLNHAS